VHGPVTLSSGAKASYYVDLRRITLDGHAAPLVGEVMLDLAADLDFEAVGGLTLGADPVATAMLHASAARGRRLDAFVVRKEGKAHGLQRRIEGPDVAGRRVLAVEDTSTTGGSVLTAVEALREAGAEVVAVAVIVDRDTGARELVEAQGLSYRWAYTKADLGL
jgi:orotate phosphoribosyltransferase